MLILVVEDTPSIRELVVETLEDEGHAVLTASNGEEALAIVDQVDPELILLDIRMPCMDGHEFAQEYARHGDGAPIVVMTASMNPAKAANDVHAVGYLAKPFNLDDLVATVREVEAIEQ